MECSIENEEQLNLLEEKNYNYELNPNIIYKEELIDDCKYDYYENNFNFDIYILNFDKEKIFISFISKKDETNIIIKEVIKDNNINNIITLKNEYNNKITAVKHYFNHFNKKDYLLSTDYKGNLFLWEIISINEYKLKNKIKSTKVRNRNWQCSVFNQNTLFPGMKNKMGIGCMYNDPFNSFNPMKNFGRNKMNFFGDNFGFENHLGMYEEPFVIDYIGYSLLFFTSNNNYILVLYRESSSIAILDLETFESKGRIYDQSSTNSLLQWYNSNDKINYLIIGGYDKIDILNPLEKTNNSYFVFNKKENENLKGGNYAYSILYNFKDNNDYLLSYTKFKIINIINLNSKMIISSINIKNEINSLIPWNKKYLIACIGNNYGENKFSRLSIIHIDSKKIITEINDSKNKIVKGGIKKIIDNFHNINLIISDSEGKIQLWVPK